jgi:hypothetical protein
MASYRIICDNQAPVGAPRKHAHVVEVGVGTTAANWNRLLTLSQVLGMMDRGDTWRMPASPPERSPESCPLPVEFAAVASFGLPVTPSPTTISTACPTAPSDVDRRG